MFEHGSLVVAVFEVVVVEEVVDVELEVIVVMVIGVMLIVVEEVLEFVGELLGWGF